MTRPTIVIAEPDDLIRDLLERWLAEAGFAVVCQGGSLAGTAPHLVIADISAPGRADDTIALLRASYRAPILALSTRFRRGLGASAEAARRLSVAKVLPKPFAREELLSAVRETIAPPSRGPHD